MIYVKYSADKYLISLKTFRIMQGYTMYEFADEIGISNSYYSKLENQKYKISLSNKIEYSENLGYIYDVNPSKTQKLYHILNKSIELYLSAMSDSAKDELRKINYVDVCMTEYFIDYYLVELLVSSPYDYTDTEIDKIISEFAIDFEDDSLMLYRLLSHQYRSLSINSSVPKEPKSVEIMHNSKQYFLNYNLSTYHLVRYELDKSHEHIANMVRMISDDTHPNRISKIKNIEFLWNAVRGGIPLDDDYLELMEYYVKHNIDKNAIFYLKNSYLNYLLLNEKYLEYVKLFDELIVEYPETKDDPFYMELLYQTGLCYYKLGSDELRKISSTLQRIDDKYERKEFVNEVNLLKSLNSRHSLNRSIERLLKKRFKKDNICNLHFLYKTLYNVLSDNEQHLQILNKHFIAVNEKYKNKINLKAAGLE